MQVYRNSRATVYDELRSISPAWQRGVVEYDAWWQVLGGELDKIVTALEQELANSVVTTMDATAVSELERFFGIAPRGTLADRRAVIGAYYRGSGRIGAEEICDVMQMFTKGIPSVELREGTIVAQVRRDIGEATSIEPAREILRARIPAHLALLLGDILNPIVLDNREKAESRLARIRFKSRLYNYDKSVIVFDGDHDIDGSWEFNHAIKGGWLARITIKPEPLRNANSIIRIYRIPRVIIAEKYGEMSLHQIRFTFAISTCPNEVASNTGISFRAGFSNEATIGKVTVIYGDYHTLDGTYMLDGTKTLNSGIIKEEI